MEAKEAISIDTYFATLLRFRLDCEKDKALNPATQLLFRLLVEQANCHRWQDTFTYPIDAIIKTSHLARQTIIDSRRRLKNKGYIDYSGNPSEYRVNSLVDREKDRSGTPRPPITIQQKTKTKEERKERRKEHGNNDNSPEPGGNPPATLSAEERASIEAELDAELKALGY